MVNEPCAWCPMRKSVPKAHRQLVATRMEIAVNGKRIHLGVFKEIEAATTAYTHAKECYAPLPRKKPCQLKNP